MEAETGTGTAEGGAEETNEAPLARSTTFLGAFLPEKKSFADMLGSEEGAGGKMSD